MPSISFILLDYVCPSLGVIMATLTFAAPVSSLRDRLARGTLGCLNPTPWAMMTGNCMGWVGYSYLTKDLFVLFANVPGLIVSIWLNIGACKLQYREYYDAKLRYRLGNADNGRAILSSPGIRSSATSDDQEDEDDDNDYEIEVEIVPSTVRHERKVIQVVIFWAIVFSVIAHVKFTTYMREQIIGYIVNVNLCFFYGAPLSTITEVCRTRSSSSLHVRTVGMTVLNTFFWLAYGAAVSDPFIYVPNGVGFILGCAQALLLAIFPSKTGRPVEDGAGDVREVLLPDDDSSGAWGRSV